MWDVGPPKLKAVRRKRFVHLLLRLAGVSGAGFRSLVVPAAEQGFERQRAVLADRQLLSQKQLPAAVHVIGCRVTLPESCTVSVELL